MLGAKHKPRRNSWVVQNEDARREAARARRAELEKERLAAKLRELGVDPDSV